MEVPKQFTAMYILACKTTYCYSDTYYDMTWNITIYRDMGSAFNIPTIKQYTHFLCPFIAANRQVIRSDA